MDPNQDHLTHLLASLPKREKTCSFPSIYASMIEQGWFIYEEQLVVEVKQKRKRSGKKKKGKRACKPPSYIEKKIPYYHCRPPKDSCANKWSERPVPRVYKGRLYILPSWYFSVATEQSVKYHVPSLFDICLNQSLKPYLSGKGTILDWYGQSFLHLFM